MSDRRLKSSRRGGAAVVILAIVAVLAIAFAVYWFAFRTGGGAGEQLAVARIPASAQVIGGLDIPGLLGSDLAKKLSAGQAVSIEEVAAKMKSSGVDLATLKAFAFGMVMPADGPPSVLGVGQGAFDQKAIEGAIAAAKGLAAEKGASSALPFDNFKVLDGGVVLLGAGSLYDEAIALSSGQGTSIASDAGMAELRSKIDTGATFWVAGAVPPNMLRQAKSMMKVMGDMGNPTHFAISGKIGSDVTVQLVVRFDKDVSAAVDRMSGMLSAASAFASGPEGEILSSLSISASGPMLMASVTIPEAFVMSKIARKTQGELPQ